MVGLAEKFGTRTVGGLKLTPRLVQRARKRLAESSLHEFIKQAWKIVEPVNEFVDGFHIHAMCDHLEAMSDLRIRKAVFNLPPRHMKSLAVSVFWPCWHWTRNPGARWMFMTYADQLCVRDSEKCRRIIESAWYQSNWPMEFQRQTNTYLENTTQGYRLASTVAGKGVGLGADFIIVDDPLKPNEAHSQVAIDFVNNWWDGTMATRQEDPKTTRRLINMQRLAENDLSGHCLKKGDYEHLCLPAKWESDHPYAGKKSTSIGWIDDRVGGPDGALLWPLRFGPNELKDLENEMGGIRIAAGQLQQRPAPSKGGIFSKQYFQYFSMDKMRVGDGSQEVDVFRFLNEQGQQRVVPCQDCTWFQTCDTALKTEDHNAYTVCITFAVTPFPLKLLVVDVSRERIEVPLQFKWILERKQKWPLIAFQAVEEKASGIGLIQQSRLRGSPFVPLKADTDKQRRAIAISNQYASLMVLHLQGADWLGSFEHELTFFPSGEFADQVDCMSYGGMIVQGREFQNLISQQSYAFDPAEQTTDAGQLASENAIAELLTGRTPQDVQQVRTVNPLERFGV